MEYVPSAKPVKSKDRTILIIIIVVLLVIILGILGLFCVSLLLFGGDSSDLVFNPNIGVIEIKGTLYESEKILKTMKKYEDDPDIKAILMRVDSPGGPVTPFQEINEEVERLKRKKPVVASFATTAASGGYYAACSSSLIVSNPSSVTGSIGVIVYLTNLKDLLTWTKVKNDVVKSGEFKDIGSPFREMTPAEKKLMQGTVDDIFDQFVNAIAKGRNLPVNDIKKIADGRILTGQQAKKLGLVDELGNFHVAVRLAAKLGNIQDEPKLLYPKKDYSGFLDMFLDSKLGSLLDLVSKKDIFRFAAVMDPILTVQ